MTMAVTSGAGGAQPVTAANRVVSWLAGLPWWVLALATVGLSILKYGISLYPSWPIMDALAANWRDPLMSPLLQPPANFRFEDPTAALAAGWLHLTSPRAYVSFTAFLAVAALALPFCLGAVRRDARLRLVVVLLTVGSAIPNIALAWVGGYDAVQIGAAAVAALTRNRMALVAAWFFMAFNNWPLAIVALVVYAFVAWRQEGRSSVARLVPATIGLVAGLAAILVTVRDWGGSPSAFYLFFDFYGPRRYFDHALDYFPLIVFSVLGVGWFIFAAGPARRVPAARALLMAAVPVALLMPFVVLDETRIVASAMWAPVLLAAALTVERLPTEDVDALIRRMAPIALAVIVVIAWDGQLVYPGWEHASNVVQYIFTHKPIPASG